MKPSDLDQCLNRILKFASENLPEGWEIEIKAYHDDAAMELSDPDGNEVSTDWDAEMRRLFYMVNHAREAEGMASAVESGEGGGD